MIMHPYHSMTSVRSEFQNGERGSYSSTVLIGLALSGPSDTSGWAKSHAYTGQSAQFVRVPSVVQEEWFLSVANFACAAFIFCEIEKMRL